MVLLDLLCVWSLTSRLLLGLGLELFDLEAKGLILLQHLIDRKFEQNLIRILDQI